MSSLNMRLTAYDALDQVIWAVKVWDFDDPTQDYSHGYLYLSGAMPGAGLSDPTRWLRALLEECREAL